MKFQTPGVGIFKTNVLLWEFEKWDPDIFPKSQISRISFSIHSEWAHIKLNGSQSWFAGLRGTPFNLFNMGWMLKFGWNGPPKLFIHLGGVLVNHYLNNNTLLWFGTHDVMHAAPAKHKAARLLQQVFPFAPSVTRKEWQFDLGEK